MHWNKNRAGCGITDLFIGSEGQGWDTDPPPGLSSDTRQTHARVAQQTERACVMLEKRRGGLTRGSILPRTQPQLCYMSHRDYANHRFAHRNGIVSGGLKIVNTITHNTPTMLSMCFISSFQTPMQKCCTQLKIINLLSS